MKPLPKPNIVDLFEHYGSKVLPGSGTWRKAQCPLHQDRNPSASISEEYCKWQCFSCGKSGDAIDLIMEVTGAGFADARETAEGFVERSGGSVQPAAHSSSSLLPHRTGTRQGGGSWVPPWRSM